MRAGNVVYRALGVFLLLVPFVPLRQFFPGIRGIQATFTPAQWLLGLTIVLPVSWLITLCLSNLRQEKSGLTERVTGPCSCFAWGRLLAPLLIFAQLSLISIFVFEKKPHLVDSIVQLFQAKIFALGQLSAVAPQYVAFFLTQHMLVDSGAWYSQYPPGHSAVLALGVIFASPWLIPVLLSLASAVLLYLFVGTIYDLRTARVCFLLCCLSPFFLFMGASQMNHVSALFFVCLFLYVLARWEQTNNGYLLMLAGVALGGAFLSRPLTALVVAFVFSLFAFGEILRGKRLLPYINGGLCFAAVSGLFLLYNARTTGDPLLSGYLKLWGSHHGLGFHQTPWGELHTPLSGLRNELADLSLLNEYLFEWPIPSLIPLGLFFASGWFDKRWDRRLLIAFLSIPAAYFFYWHRDQFLGPRFLYSGLAFVLPLSARALVVAWERLDAVHFKVPGLFKAVRGSLFGLVVFVLCLLYAVSYSIPQRFVIYASSLRSMKLDLAKEARAKGIEEGLIFVSVSWGNRLLSELREAGVSASLAEEVYRKSDHCSLYQLLREAGERQFSAQRLSEAVEDLLKKPVRLGKPRWNGDPTLRVKEEYLAEAEEFPRVCAEQILYDRKGYTTYTPHLAANEPGLDGEFVFARDLRERNKELQELYPHKSAYLYRAGRFERL